MHFARDFPVDMLHDKDQGNGLEGPTGGKMRLICPNCDAQYEVPDQVMPLAGRDVQCSNCGQTWFQHHPDNAPQDDVTDDPADAEEERADPPEPVVPDKPTPDGAAPARKRLDPAVADILRQEAEAEHEARKKAAAAATTQAGAVRTNTAEDEDREARLREMRNRDDATPNPVVSKAVAAALNSRRDLLPDIDEINSSLRSDSETPGSGAQVAVEAPTRQRKKRGFRKGFFGIIVLFAIAVAVYIFAPQISAAVPALEPAMQSYAQFVDAGRIWLDGQVQSLLMWLDSMTAEQAAQ